MDAALNIPIIDSQEPAEPGTVASATPQMFDLSDLKNYASDPNVQQQLASNVYPIIEWCRLNRVTLEQTWLDIYRMDQMTFDTNQMYIGRSNSYMPLWSRIRQSLVSALSRGLFPSDEYMNVYSRDGNPETARPLKAYMQWELDKVAQVKRFIKPFLSQFVSLGNAPLKYWYKKTPKGQGFQARMKKGMVSRNPIWERLPFLDGLRVMPRNMLYFYTWPTTAASLDDCTMVFEDIDVPRSYVEEMLRKKIWENEQGALSYYTPPNHMMTQSELHTNTFGTTPPFATPPQGPLAAVKVITECWTFLHLPADAYFEGEDTNEPVPVYLTLAGNSCLRATRNPFWHQRPPYLFAQQNTTPGVIFGYGQGKVVQPLQYQMNDFVNQTNDCGQYSLNPIAVVNPGLLSGPLPPLFPGVVWETNDINEGIKFMHPPEELMEQGLAMVQWYAQQGQDMTGTPALMQGISAGKGARTATQSQILQRNVMSPIQDTVEDLELAAMIPLLYGAWVNAQQFRDANVMAAVAGEQVPVSLEDLGIDAEFEWCASSQAQNQQQRAQQALQLLSAIAPLMPQLNAQGYVVDLVPLIKRVYTDGFGFRGFDQFIKPGQAAPGAQPGVPAPAAQQGGTFEEQVDRVRSALEQVAAGLGGGTGDMVPGEGDDFMNVRQNADMLAAMNGGSNNSGNG